MRLGKSGSSFWKNKRVLVTGYEGFLGSNLVKQLLGFGCKVTGIDIKTHRKETILYRFPLRFEIIKGSVDDYRCLSRVISKNKIEFIFHLAADALVGDSLNNPVRSFSTNIKGTWTLLEACRRIGGIKGIIVASSDKAYGAKNKLPYREDASLNGDHPYDVSKSCADLIALTYYNTYGLPITVTRCGNIFGPGDFNFSRIVPDAMKSFFKRKVLEIRSDGKFTRDYVYVEDIVCGYLLLAEKMVSDSIKGEAFNFSNESPISVVKLIRKIENVVGGKIKYKILNKATHEIKHQYLSAAKAKRVLGWKPKYNLNNGLLKTSIWYKDYFQGRY